MKVELQTEKSTDNPDEAAILAARGDYMDDSLIGATFEEVMEGTPKTKEELVAGLLRSGHFGPFEHAQAYFHVEGISRVAMAQVTRHRHMSFDVQSQRYVNFGDKDAVIPPSFEEQEEYVEDPKIRGGYDGWEAALNHHWKRSVLYYEMAIEDGIPKEDARFFLPQATPVNLTFSANARSLMHFADLRRNMKAQWEARDFATQVIEECHKWAPLTFEGYEEHINNNSLRAP